MMMKLMASVFRLVASLLHLLPLKQRVVFMSRQSSKLSLDFKLLVDELQRGHPDVEVKTCLSEPELAGKLAFIGGTLRQLVAASTAKVVVVDGYVPAVCIPKKRKGAQVLQVWHAPGAVKKFGYQSVDTPAGRSSKSAKAAHMHENYDVIVAGGPGAVASLAEAFGYAQDAVKPLGLPRIDYLADARPEGSRCVRMESIRRANPVFDNGRVTVLYAPTLRKGAAYEGWLTKAVEELASGFDSERYNFIIAGHPLNNGFDPAVMERLPHVSFVRGAATIDLLGLADCVVTDYSAVSLEAGVLGKPVYFYAPDIDVYRQSPGLNIDPVLSFPDVASSDPAWLAKKIQQDAASERGLHQDEAFAQLIASGFDGVFDGCCSQRIVEEIVSLLDRR